MKKYKILFVALILLTCQYGHTQKQEKLKSENQTVINVMRDTMVKKSDIKKNSFKSTKIEQAPMNDPETKAVFFVHGLAGNSESWDTPQAWASDVYNIWSPQINYLYNSSIDAAESTVRSILSDINDGDILGEDYDRASSVFIGHSMGGTVALQINYEEETNDNPNKTKEFGALATFGSPLAGAPVVNGSECLDELINEGCKALASPYISESLKELSRKISNKVPGFLRGVLNLEIEEKITSLGNNITKGVCNSLTPLGFSFLDKEILPEIGHDLDPDGEVMKNLVEHEVTIPSIAYWGDEEAPVSLREIYSLQGNVVNRPDRDPNNPNRPKEKEFTADYDDGFVDVVNDLKDEMEARAIFWRTRKACVSAAVLPSIGWAKRSCKAKGGTIVPIPNNPLAFDCVFCFANPDEDLGRKFDKAAQWLRDFDNNYRICFGIDEVTYVESSKTVCKCYIKNNGPLVKTFDVPCDQVNSNPGNRNGEDIFDCGNEEITIRTKKIVSHTSDGVVPSWSAKKINVADGVYFEEHIMPNSNHQQMRNDKNAGKHFRNMFDGLYDDAFELNK